MRQIRLILMTAAALMLANVIPGYAAASQSVVTVKGSGAEEYSTLPSADTLKQDVGFAPRLAETLAGDFRFESGSATESFDLDSKGNPVNRRKGLNFRYAKVLNGVTKTVSLSVEPSATLTGTENSTVVTYGDITLYCSDMQGNSVAWVQEENIYILLDINQKVTIDELTAMAKGLIDIKTDSAE